MLSLTEKLIITKLQISQLKSKQQITASYFLCKPCGEENNWKFHKVEILQLILRSQCKKNLQVVRKLKTKRPGQLEIVKPPVIS